MPSHSVDCKFIYIDYDSEPEYGVFQLESVLQIDSIDVLKSAGGKPRSNSIQLRSGPTFVYSTIDTGSPVSFLNKRILNLLLQRSPSIHFRDVARHPIETTYVDYIKHSIRLLGLITFPISSNGWKVENVTFLISENRRSSGNCILLNGTLMYLIVYIDQRITRFILTSRSSLFLGKSKVVKF